MSVTTEKNYYSFYVKIFQIWSFLCYNLKNKKVLPHTRTSKFFKKLFPSTFTVNYCQTMRQIEIIRPLYEVQLLILLTGTHFQVKIRTFLIGMGQFLFFEHRKCLQFGQHIEKSWIWRLLSKTCVFGTKTSEFRVKNVP